MAADDSPGEKAINRKTADWPLLIIRRTSEVLNLDRCRTCLHTRDLTVNWELATGCRFVILLLLNRLTELRRENTPGETKWKRTHWILCGKTP